MSDKKPYKVNGEYISRDEYNRMKFDSFLVRVSKGKKDEIKAYCDRHGISVNEWINRLIDENMYD